MCSYIHRYISAATLELLTTKASAESQIMRALTRLANKHNDENEWRHILPSNSSISRHITVALRRT
jgi:hypothetical protein